MKRAFARLGSGVLCPTPSRLLPGYCPWAISERSNDPTANVRTFREARAERTWIMARTVRDASLGSRTARAELEPSGQPYYRDLEPGLLHLGYRKPRRGAGKWLARRYVGNGRYRKQIIAVADDLSNADGKVILSFAQAQAAARKLMVAQAGGGVGTVA